jgi:hypothetical protein
MPFLHERFWKAATPFEEILMVYDFFKQFEEFLFLRTCQAFLPVSFFFTFL